MLAAGAALLLLMGAAAATTSITVTAGPDGVTVHAESDDVPRLGDLNVTYPPPPPPPRPQPTFKLDARPDHQNTTAGVGVTFDVHLHARRDVALHLNVTNVTRGFAASLESDRVWIENGSNRSVLLTVHVPDWESRGSVTVVATAADTGERHGETVSVYVAPRVAANLSLAVDPASQTGQPGDVLNYTVYAKSTLNRTISLNVTHVPSGYRAYLSSYSVHAGPDHTARVILTVHVLENATKGGTIGIAGWTREGEWAYAEAKVALEDATTQPIEEDPNSTQPPRNSTSASQQSWWSLPPPPPMPEPLRVEDERALHVTLPWAEARVWHRTTLFPMP